MVKLFISSVQREFERERREIAAYIRQDAVMGRFFEPFLFEELPAKDVSAQQAYLAEVADTEVYLGLFGVVDQAVAFVMSHIDARVGERTQSAQVDVAYELPVQAVTETIVNAVVHRDYLSTGSVQVMLFKDRLEVWNPGRLPKGMTVEKLNGEHASLPVNPLLANPVYLAGYIEQVGTGTNDVIDRCVELGLRKPEFRQDEDFMVTLWRKEGAATGDGNHNDSRDDSRNDRVNDSLSDSVNSTYQAIKANPGIQRKRISELTGKSIPTIDRHLAFLAKSNLIEHRDSDKTGGYYAK